MSGLLTAKALKSYADAPIVVQRAFDKQLRLLAANLRHPSLQAKKYDRVSDLWQARVNRGWRFYFLMQGDRYIITDIIPDPK